MEHQPFPIVYDKATGATQGPAPGARALMTWCLSVAAPIGSNLGIYNVRPVRGSKTVWSVHAEGRACDIGFPTMPQGHSLGHILADLLVRHSAALGVQQVIWARRIWRNTLGEWRPYNGVSPHLDHVHVELTRAAAAGLTTERISLATWPRPAPPPPQETDPMAIPMTVTDVVTLVDMLYDGANRIPGSDAAGRAWWTLQAASAADPYVVLKDLQVQLAPKGT